MDIQKTLDYYCEDYDVVIKKHNATEEEINNPELPRRTFIVKYSHESVPDQEVIYDLCEASKMVKVFTMYYDIFKKNLIYIDYGPNTFKEKSQRQLDEEERSRKKIKRSKG